ncbi:Lrp/AsnC family transcriptional regulator [Neobacillus sp. PS3-40]|uniref:Lrp/AsnC family transcriptional regulator n=1 Tax=Neobacillus sp. PS3-40 TaxID=3070679 RepID=UPI0027E18FD8|nr:Lrp/AsnC family transcriptional regulator [Neobacillus sp. PS3-40]WML46528.1 Lrp/AsnC family transcriptional regulator [Neobacillus sp. PS3-40]
MIFLLDATDFLILNSLQKESQISNADLARHVNLSPPATHARVKRMEKEGYIDQQVAILNHRKLGFDLLCFIFVSTNIHQKEQLENLEGAMKTMPEVLECHCLTGEYDYLLKVANRNREELERFIRKLNLLSGVNRIQTSLSLREIKFSTALPILE